MTTRFALVLACALAGAGGAVRAQEEPATAAAPGEADAAQRAQRWKQLQEVLFAKRPILDGSALVQLQSPARAKDASLVSVELQFGEPARVRGVYLVIDQNPAPLAAHITFGPLSDPHALTLRVRVDQYTDMHAVVEADDGQLYASTRYIKAAGGCSAPAGADDREALRDIGLMKLRLLGAFDPGRPLQAQLMIRHPNFNGMQMDQISRQYTPARYIRTIDASYAGRSVFHIDADISLSTDPVITFGFVPQDKGDFDVVVRDSDEAVFHRSFHVPES